MEESDKFANVSTTSISPFLAEYFLVCAAESIELNSGTWSFSLDSVDGQTSLEANDTEIGDLNRLTLLAAVRGLEAIDGASDVTLLSQNRYLIRSLTDSLPRWRANQFAWEHFGRRIEVQNADLWRRVDHALSIHRVEACLVSSRLVSRAGNGALQSANPLNDSTFGDMPRELPLPASSDGLRGNRLGNNLGGIQWRADSSHTGPGQPALSSRSRSKRLKHDRFHRLLGGDPSDSPKQVPSESIVNSA